MKRKIILTAFAATSLIFSSTQAFALINFCAGIPFSHSFTGNWYDGDAVESDGTSGMFIQVGVPIFPGVGMDSYKTKLKDNTPTVEVATMIYNLYYLLPIPIINLTLGLGTGTTEMKCPAGTFSGIAADCSGIYDKAPQASGMPA